MVSRADTLAQPMSNGISRDERPPRVSESAAVTPRQDGADADVNRIAVSPQDFYHEVTANPAMRRILARLARA
jgi:hypothetical protein